MSAKLRPRYTIEEYFELERESEERYEFWDGDIVCMGGADPAHDQILSNIHFALRKQIQGKPCRVFLSDVRIKVPLSGAYRYGDLSGLCGEPQYEMIAGLDAITNPSIIFEILSPSTEAVDRGVKFTDYKSIPSLIEYVMVAQNRPHVTHCWKVIENDWSSIEIEDLSVSIRLRSLECELVLREIYEGIAFTTFS